MSKKILVALGIIIIVILVFYFYKKSAYVNNPLPASSETPKQTDISKDPPTIVSTKPDPLEDMIISATDIVEITFNRPLENVGEFKSHIEPKIGYKVELSGDRKTAKIIPAKPYQLGTTYTLFINPDTKFDGVGEWRQDKTFHFKTITYRGV